MMQKISFVVPVYNTIDTLEKIVAVVQNSFADQKQYRYEIIFVNDSPANERTAATLNKIAGLNKNVKVVHLTQNYGQHAATLCGMAKASGEYIVTIDDDLQHDPRDVFKLLEFRAHDIVVASFPKKEHPFFVKITSYIKGAFDSILIGKPKHIQLSAFRLIKKETVDSMLLSRGTDLFIPSLMFSVTKDVVNVECEHKERQENRTGYSFIMRTRLFTNLLINNSSLLLRLSGCVGIFVSLSALFYAIYIFLVHYFKIKTGAPVGWLTIIIVVLFMGGFNLFSLGIIGEYLIRIIRVSEKRPQYCIRREIN
jgi:dolichol-phosphate mannosyltransferase/undecaprenyl-phosphate 4-deoxy-4-formamido-L-arabinose transferase